MSSTECLCGKTYLPKNISLLVNGQRYYAFNKNDAFLQSGDTYKNISDNINISNLTSIVLDFNLFVNNQIKIILKTKTGKLIAVKYLGKTNYTDTFNKIFFTEKELLVQNINDRIIVEIQSVCQTLPKDCCDKLPSSFQLQNIITSFCLYEPPACDIVISTQPCPTTSTTIVPTTTTVTTIAPITTTLQPDVYSNNGTTFTGMGSAQSPFYLIIDLGQIRTFSTARYYQMFSDGKTTHVALDISSNNQLNTRSSPLWTQVHGYALLDNSSTSNGVPSVFSPTTARYLRLRMYNDGRYNYTSFTELYNFKLFDNTVTVNFASTENGATVGTGSLFTDDSYAGPNLWASRYELNCSTNYSWGVLQALCTNGSNTNLIQRSIK